MSDLLKDRVAVVTGAAMGNGQAIARAMAEQGARVVLLDILAEVEKTAAEIKRISKDSLSFQVDTVDAPLVRETFKTILKQFGRVDILVNNAGIYPMVMFVDMSDEMRDRIFDVNIKGPWNCAKAVVPAMIEKRYGRIINMSSISAFMADAGESAYCVSKGAVSAFSRALAVEVAPYGITVNTICPGFIDTPGLRRLGAAGGGNHQALYAMLTSSVPMGRMGTAEDVANAALFLASDMSSYITGQEIVVDGGNTLKEINVPEPLIESDK